MRLHIATGVEDDEPEPFSHRGPPTTRRRDVRASNHTVTEIPSDTLSPSFTANITHRSDPTAAGSSLLSADDSICFRLQSTI